MTSSSTLAPREWIEAHIIQEEVNPDISVEFSSKSTAEITGKPTTPLTAALGEWSWLKKYTHDHIFGQTRKDITQVLHIPPMVVEEWGLREGDKIRYDPDRGFERIFDVNGINNPQKTKNRPNILDFDHEEADYASRRIPVEKFGNKTLRADTILAPFGKGQRLFIVSPPSAGKSVTMSFLWEACLRLTQEDHKLYIVGLLVGERAEDATVLKSIIHKTQHDADRCELYLSPFGEPVEGHFYLTRFVVNRARRLCELGYDVVLFIDSMTRVFVAHSDSVKIVKPKGSGLISGGLSRYSIQPLRSLLSVAGDFGDKSLTIVATMLTDIKKEKRSSSESALYYDTGPSTSTAIWGLVYLQGLQEPPWIDISLTHARRWEKLCTDGQISEHNDVRSNMQNASQVFDPTNKKGPAQKALDHLMWYVTAYPDFTKTKYAEQDNQVRQAT